MRKATATGGWSGRVRGEGLSDGCLCCGAYLVGRVGLVVRLYFRNVH